MGRCITRGVIISLSQNRTRKADVQLLGSLTKADIDEAYPGLELADEIFPDRCKSVEDWMRKYNYNGEYKSTLKLQEDLLRVTSEGVSQI